VDRDFDEALAHALASNAEVPDSILEGLSGLDGLALRRFHDVWEKLPVERRAELLARLGEMAEANLVLDFEPIFVAAITDRDAAVREQAYQLAAQEPRPVLLEAYLRAALTDPDDDARLSAVSALSQFALTAQTDDWPEITWRQIETALLGLVRLPEADLALRREALLSVSYLTTPNVEEAIGRASGDPEMRDVALAAMGRNCQPIWIPQIVQALEDEDAEVREVAVAAAAELEDEELIPHLVARLNDEDDEVRLGAVAALGTTGGPMAREALTDLLTVEDRALREAARDALEMLLEGEDPFSM
jgi:HEAT repeat protein